MSYNSAMQQDEQHLRWALGFAQADLATWRPGDWLNALDDLDRMLTPREGEPVLTGRDSVSAGLTALLVPAIPGRRPNPAEVREWLTPVQTTLRGFLDQLDKGRKEAQRKRGTPWFERVRVPFTGTAMYGAEPPYRRLWVAFTPKAPQPWEALSTAVVLRVGDLLTRMDLARLRHCPECGRLFLAVRRQRFDSPQCSARDRARRFRAGYSTRRRRGRATTRES